MKRVFFSNKKILKLFDIDESYRRESPRGHYNIQNLKKIILKEEILKQIFGKKF